MKARTFALTITAILLGAAALPGTASDIDNCCYVDRQCHSNQDWINGWHAYQNGQCQAPAQSPAPAPAQRASGVLLRTATGVVIGYTSGHRILPTTAPTVQCPSGQICSTNNCCQITWQCNSEQDWAEGYSMMQNNQGLCPLPGLISILGDPAFVDHLERALEALKTRAPQLYDYVLNGLDKIEQRFDTTWSNVSSDRAFYVSWRDVDIGRLDAIYDAAVLVTKPSTFIDLMLPVRTSHSWRRKGLL